MLCIGQAGSSPEMRLKRKAVFRAGQSKQTLLHSEGNKSPLESCREKDVTMFGIKTSHVAIDGAGRRIC